MAIELTTATQVQKSGIRSSLGIGEVDVASYATAGNGSSGSPWTGWDTAITWTSFTRYKFRAGWYSYSTSPNFAQYGIELIGDAGANLLYTGTKNAFIMDAGGRGTFTADAGTDVLTLPTQHGFRDGMPCILTTTGTLPAGLSLATTYYVRDLSGDTCKLAATSGGAAINITTTGSGTHTIASHLWIQNVKVEGLSLYGQTTNLTGLLSVSSGTTTVTGSGTSFTTQLEVGDSITFTYGTSSAKSYVISAIASNTSLTINRNATITETNSQAKSCRAKNGFFLRGLRNGSFDRLMCKDVVGAAIYSEACVTNSLRLFRTTYHEPTQFSEFQCRPQYGIQTAGREADWSTCWTIEEPVIEGTQIYGIWFTSTSYGNTVINGTSEGNPGLGIKIESPRHQLINIDLESNLGGDLDIATGASQCQLIGVQAFGTTTLSGTTSNNTILSGYYQTLTIGSSTSRNFLIGAYINGTLTDSSTTTYKITTSATSFRSRLGINTRSTTAPNAGTIAVDANQTERVQISTSSDCTMAAPSNPINGDQIEYVFHNNSGSTKNLTWNAVFQSLTGATLPATIATGGTVYVLVEYSSFWSKWQCKRVAGS